MKRCIAWTAAAGLAGAVAFMTLAPMRFRPRTGHGRIERFGAFGLVGIAVGLAAPRRPLAAAATMAGAATALEAMQNLTPDRHGRPQHAFEKATGGVAGVVLAWAVTACGRLFRRPAA